VKHKTLFSVIALIFAMSAFSQKAAIDLTFTAVKNGVYVQLDSIRVMNRTQGGETVIHWPDTTLTIDITPGDLLLYIGYSTGYPVGVREISQGNKQFHLFQNFPNPVKDRAEISMFLPGKGTVVLIITDVQGRLLNAGNKYLDAGYHSFRFVPGDENFYFLSVRWNGISQSIKILATGTNPGQRCMLDYTGSGYTGHTLKASLLKNDLIMQESGILDAPASNETYTFQFATNITCPGIPTVTYEGQVYNTIQVFSQCWLKENLNVGTMISGNQNQSNNGLKEKYCYNNNPDSCTKYGGLYQWNEMMQYTTQQGVQGICPPGWHLPADEDWKVLEGAVDSQYGIGDPEWDIYWEWRGLDAGTNLKTTSGWYGNDTGTDLFGFSGLPGGNRNSDGTFFDVGGYGIWWTSAEYSYDFAWYRCLYSLYPGVLRYSYSYKENGCSVRCLRYY